MQKPSPAMVMLFLGLCLPMVAVVLARVCKGIGVGLSPPPFFKKYAAMGIGLALCLACGTACYVHRCAYQDTLPSHGYRRTVEITVEATDIVVKDGELGLFHGYGTIVDGPKDMPAPPNSRIFFSVVGTGQGKNQRSAKSSRDGKTRAPRQKVTAITGQIPLGGEKFRVVGKLRCLRDDEANHFFQYLKKSKVHWHMGQGMLLSCDGPKSGLRMLFRRSFLRFMRALSSGVDGSEIDNGIVIGMLTGAKQNIDGRSRRMFSDLGIAHLFAVSGIHIGIVATTIDFILRIFCLGKRARTLPTLIITALYVNAIGCSPSAVRAAVMVAFYHAATLLGRKPNVVAALANGAMLHALYDPFVAFNISFLLSYSVVAGIVLIGSPLKNFLHSLCLDLHGLRLESYRPVDRLIHRTKRALLASFSLSLGAYLVSLPLSIEHFGTLPLLTIPVNMFVVPIAAWAIVVGAVTVFCGVLGLWPICAVLNKISCAITALFRLLSQCMYYEPACLRDVSIDPIGGAALTMAILLCAHAIAVGGRPFRRFVDT
jgi:ComEC/Rec2-related protein